MSKNVNAVTATTAPASAASSEPKPWHKLPDEPNLWYDRFLAYLSLGRAGPSRSSTGCAAKHTKRISPTNALAPVGTPRPGNGAGKRGRRLR